MNSIEKLLSEGLHDDLRKILQPGEVYYIAPGKISGSADEASNEVRKAARRIEEAAPDGTRIIAWLCLRSDGSAVDGEIAVDGGRDAPQIVWSLKDGRAELVYASGQTLRFTSASDQLVAASDPVEALRSVGTKFDDVTADLVRALAYTPVIVFNERMTTSFTRLELERVDG